MVFFGFIFHFYFYTYLYFYFGSIICIKIQLNKPTLTILLYYDFKIISFFKKALITFFYYSDFTSDFKTCYRFAYLYKPLYHKNRIKIQ